MADLCSLTSPGICIHVADLTSIDGHNKVEE